eukprot:363203-Chlamydomonas_euryale.AAC.41
MCAPCAGTPALVVAALVQRLGSVCPCMCVDTTARARARTTDGVAMHAYVSGFEVSPCSIRRTPGLPLEDVVCGVDDFHIRPQEVKENEEITYSYDVYWQKSNIKWASRWDAYLRMPGGNVHWFSIVNSCVVVLVMATLVAIILIRTGVSLLSRAYVHSVLGLLACNRKFLSNRMRHACMSTLHHLSQGASLQHVWLAPSARTVQPSPGVRFMLAPQAAWHARIRD